MKMEYVKDIENMNEKSFNPSAVEKKALEKIHRRGVRRRRPILLAAVLVFVLGLGAFAVSENWNDDFGKMIGADSQKADLEAGYINLCLEKEDCGITVALSNSLADNHAQWIQIDTSLDYPEKGYYMFDSDQLSISEKENGPTVGYGTELSQFDNDGRLSFMYIIESDEDMSRKHMKLELSGLSYYEDEDSDIVSEHHDGEFEFKWKNDFDVEQVVIKPDRKVTLHTEKNEYSCTVEKIELSPVTLSVYGKMDWDGTDDDEGIYIDAVTLDDGTAIKADRERTIGSLDRDGNTAVSITLIGNRTERSGVGYETIDGSRIKSVTIGGEAFEIR